MSFSNISEALLTFLSASDLNARSQAELFLNSIPEKDFQGGIYQYLSALDLQDEKLCELAALLLKKQYIDKDEILQKIPDNILGEIVKKVEQSINENRKTLYIKRACEILVKLYTNKNGLAQLMLLIQKFSQATTSNLKIGLMYLIEIICEYSFNDEELMKYSGEFSAIFSKFMDDSDIKVRAETFKSLTGFLCSIEEDGLLKSFEGVFPTLISKCVECIQADEEAGSTSLNSLVDLIDIHPKFVKPITYELLNLFTEIISTHQLSDSLRIKGLSGILSICTSCSAQVKKGDIFKTKTAPALIKMMTEVDSLSLEEWTEELDDEALSKNDPASAAEETLAKIGYELTNKYLLPIFIPLIKECIAAGSWNTIHAGLVAIANLTEGIAESFKNDLSQIIAMVQSQESNNHIRVQYSILTAYSLLCTEFTPDIQQNHGDLILNFILKNLESTNSKLKHRSISSIINFCKELIEQDEDCEIIKTYADKLLLGVSQTFEKCLSENNQRTLEETLICLSTIAVTLETEFVKYYNNFMPGLQTLIQTLPATNSQQISIRTHTIECMGYLLSAVRKNKEIFYRDSEIIMNALLAMQNDPKMEKDDPHHSPILVVYAQIADAMKEGFSKYLPAIAQKILQGASISIDLVAEDVIDGAPQKQDYDKSKFVKYNFDLGMLGGMKALQLNMAALEQKIEAFHTLYAVAAATKTAFLPYVEQSLEIVTKHISFKHSRDISETCIKTLKFLMAACGNDQAKISAIFNNIAPTLLQLLTNSVSQSNADDVYILITNITECYKRFVNNSGINLEVVEKITQQAAQSLKIAADLKKEVIKQFANEDMDDDDDAQAEFEEQYDEANSILQGMLEFVPQTVKFFPSLEAVVVNSILPDYYAAFSKETSSDNEINIALCVFTELFQYCSEPIFQRAYVDMTKKYLDYARDYENNDIKQTAVFGIGVVAKRSTHAQFQQFYQDSLTILSGLFINPAFQQQEVVCVFENILAALFKIAIFQVQDETVRAEILSKCLPRLPLKEDIIEAQNLHELLLKLLQENNPAVCINSDVKNLALEAVNRIKTYFAQKPESEILNQAGKTLIQL
ncbi:hypothetical protein ABPG72_018103 [Tetrahymena utriculariae]